MVSQSSMSALFALFVVCLISSACTQALQCDYYDKSCKDFEDIVARKVREWFNKDKTIAPSLVRLHFHDCSVRGCDASVLLNYPGSERMANASRTLRGFEVIDDIKKTVEKKCPGIVSCADILTAAARDATYLVKGPFWGNEYGRKDGKVSKAEEAEQVPMGHEDVTSLIEFYQSKGLTVLDLVVLSGAHTIGRSSCRSVQDRLYNHKGTGQPDPSIAPKYLNYLRRKCRSPTQYADLDATTPYQFDSKYYANLVENMGVLYTDQVLYSDHRTSHLVNSFASQDDSFPYLFSSSMVKLGGILGDADDDGEVRHECSRINSY